MQKLNANVFLTSKLLPGHEKEIARPWPQRRYRALKKA